MQPKKIIGEIYTCPICKKDFKMSIENAEIMYGKYCCSWKCFNEEDKRRLKEKAAMIAAKEKLEAEKLNNIATDIITTPIVKKRRGRPRKEQ